MLSYLKPSQKKRKRKGDSRARASSGNVARPATTPNSEPVRTLSRTTKFLLGPFPNRKKELGSDSGGQNKYKLTSGISPLLRE